MALPARPQRVFDAHFHVIDPSYPLVPNDGYLPPTFLATDLAAALTTLLPPSFALAGGAVVSGSFQAFDQTYLVASLAALGAPYVGVAQLPPDATDVTIIALHDNGVRAVRFNLVRGMADDLAVMRSLAQRVHALVGWHCEFYVNSEKLMDAGVWDLLFSLPCVVVDHVGLSEAGFPHLLRLVKGGNVYVKVTGFSRWLGSRDGLRTSLVQLLAMFPTRVVFASDLPSTRAPVPFGADDVTLLLECIAEGPWAREGLQEEVFWKNAMTLYRCSD